jgi:mannose/fructose/N-acetylgalactosamine-specific phosphotransferase system component IIC
VEVVEVIIWAAAVFTVGGLLVLERHCLGQRALIQPLTLCLAAGLLSDHVETGIWLGVTMQLLSATPTRTVDWALSGAVAAILLVVAPRLGMKIVTGDLNSSSLLLVAVCAGFASRILEKWYAKTDLGRIQNRPPWKEADPIPALERAVYRATVRWFIVGGIEVTIGVGIGLAAIRASYIIGGVSAQTAAICAVMLPTLGTAVVISALVERRLIVWSGISMGLSIAALLVVMR